MNMITLARVIFNSFDDCKMLAKACCILRLIKERRVIFMRWTPTGLQRVTGFLLIIHMAGLWRLTMIQYACLHKLFASKAGAYRILKLKWFVLRDMLFINYVLISISRPHACCLLISRSFGHATKPTSSIHVSCCSGRCLSCHLVAQPTHLLESTWLKGALADLYFVVSTLSVR